MAPYRGRHRGGRRRAERSPGRRFAGALGWVLLAALLPALCLGAVAWYYVRPHSAQFIKYAVSPAALLWMLAAVGVGWLVWLLLIAGTWRVCRPRSLPRGRHVGGVVFVTALCLLVTAPLAQGARYLVVQRSLITSVFDDEHSATAPTATRANPWGHRSRVNVLLLGGDGGIDREGIRTDSVMLVSVDTKTGRAITIGLPRNLRNVPFPAGSPLATAYPNGFDTPGAPDGESMLNAVYRNVPAQHPGILGRSDNEGADAVKEAVSGALGVPVDYYVLVNLDGFRRIVQAIGGITVNVNERVAIGGNHDANIPPTGWIEPGPNQRLNGFKALWFTRGRWGSTDYSRMERQRCAIRAIVDEANPGTLLRRYAGLAEASKKILRTDIPRKLLPAFVDLAMRMKGKPLKSVVFNLSASFNPNDPDFDFVHAAVRRAMQAPRRHAASGGAAASPDSAPDSAPGSTPGSTGTPTSTASPDVSGKVTDADDDCAYHPDQGDSTLD